MRTLLKILVGLFSVFVILILSVFLIINLVDWNRHREFLIGLVERNTSVRIDELEGIHVQLWRSTELGVDKFKMHMADKDASLQNFSIGKTQVRIATWPLLFKDQLLIQSFTVGNGRLDMKEVKKKEEEPAQEEQSPSDVLAKLPKIFINLAAVTDARFRYDSLEKKEPLTITIDNFKVEAPKEDPKPKLSAEGKVDDFAWKMDGETGTLEAFQDEEKPFPFRLHAEMGKQDIDVKGAVKFADTTGDFSVKAKGPDLEQIKKLLHLNMGRVPAYQLSFDSRLEPQNFKFSKIDLKVGESQLNGNLHLDLRPRRPKISGKLEAPVIVQTDLDGIFKSDERYKPANEPPKAPGQYFSDKVVDVSVMKMMDVDLRFLTNRYLGEKMGKVIHAWDATIKMTNGDLKIAPVTFAVASGNIGGRFLINGSKLPLDVHIELGAKRVNLNTLFAPLAKEIPVFDMKPSEMARGHLTGQLDLKMKGKTPMELARSVRGPIELAIEDGELAGTVFEAFGIDITETIHKWIKKHPRYDIQCALTAFEAKDGGIDTKTFLIATKDTSIIGKGGVNLVGNKVDVELRAHPHDFSIGSLRSPILIRGPLDDIGVGLKKEPLAARAGLAVALGTLVSPIAALVPLIETGLDEKGKCRTVVAQLNAVSEKAKQLSSGKAGRVTR